MWKNKNKGHGSFWIEQIRDGKVIRKIRIKNTTTYAGLNSLLNVGFRAATQLTAWYCGLVDNSGFTANPNTDTAASHAGWTEFTTYSESVRQTWSPTAASAGSITNTSAMVFTISGSGSINGIFIVSNNTKGGTSGTLWSSASFGSPLTVASSDVLRITYSYTIT